MIDYPENLIPKHYWKSSIPPEEVRTKKNFLIAGNSMPKRNIRIGPRNLQLQRRKVKANVTNWQYTLHFYPEESPETENKGDKGWRKLALTGIWDVIRKTAYHFTT